MQITITNTGIKVTEALKEYILDKFKRLEHITNNTPSVHVTLSLENLEQVAKASIHAHGRDFHASAESKDLYAAIDKLIDRIELKINKHKQKEKEKRHDKSGHFKVEDDDTKER